MLEMFNKMPGPGIALKMYFGEERGRRQGSETRGQMFSDTLRPRDIQGSTLFGSFQVFQNELHLRENSNFTTYFFVVCFVTIKDMERPRRIEKHHQE